MENQNQNQNAFDIHNAIVTIVTENQSLFVNDDVKKMSFLVDNIENMSMQAVKHYLNQDDTILFDPELIEEMNNLRDAAKALQSNKVFKNPAMSGILKKQIDSLTKEYNKNLLKLVAPIYLGLGEEQSDNSELENEDCQESSENQE